MALNYNMMGLGFHFFVRDDASLGLNKIGSEFDNVQARAEEAFNSAKADMDKFEKSLGALGEPRVQAALRGTGMAMMGIGAAGLAGLGMASRSYASFEQEMLNARSVAQWAEQDYQRLSRFAIKVGAETKFTASQAAAAIYEISSAGVTAVQDIEKLTMGVASFAAAGGTDMPEASRAIISAVNGFRLPMEKATHVADVLTRSVQLSMLRADELPIAVGNMAGIAGQVGQSVESAMAGLMAARAVIGSAEDAATSYRAAMMHLIAPTNEAAGMLDALGISLRDPQGRMKAWPQIIREFELSFKAAGPLIDQFREFAGAADEDLQALGDAYGLSGAQARGLANAAAQGTRAFQDYIIASVFGQDGIRAVTAGLNAQTVAMVDGREVTLTGAEALKYWQSELEKSAGTAQQAANVQMSGLKGAMEEFSGSVESAGLSLAGPLAGAIRGAAKLLTSLTNIFNGLPKPLQAIASWSILIGSTGLLAGGGAMLFLSKLPDTLRGIKVMRTLLSDLGVTASLTRVKLLAKAAAIYAVKGATALWTGVQWLLNASLWGCPIVWIIAAVAALIAIVILLVKNWKKVVAVLTGWWNWIKTTWGKMPGWLKVVVGYFLVAFMPIIGIPLMIALNWKRVVKVFWIVVDAFKRAIAWIGGAWRWLVGQVQAFFGWFARAPWWIKTIGLVFMPFITLPLMAVTYWRRLITTIKNVLTAVVNAVLGVGKRLYDAGRNVFGALWRGVKSALGIHSPSYIERAMFNVGDATRGTLIQLKRDFGEMNRLSAAPRVTLGGGQVVPFPARVPTAHAEPMTGGARAPRVARPARAAAPSGGGSRLVVRQPVQLILDGRVIAETVLEFDDDRRDREVS
ncbi:MAG: phage tail tape measure protein [Patescibacteria group bacterium]